LINFIAYPSLKENISFTNWKLSACIGIIRCIFEILLFQPQLFFLILWNVNPLNLKNKGVCAVITADDHHSAVICSLAHNGAAMQRCINISADGTLFADSFLVMVGCLWHEWN